MSPNITVDDYLKASQIFHWATLKHYVMWFTGSTRRHHKSEHVLPKLARRYEDEKTRKNSLFSIIYKKQKIYACPRRVRNPDLILLIDHGLGCSESMVRLWRSDMNAEIIPERRFYPGGCIPDFGLKFESGTMLLVEYTTQSNFGIQNMIKSKLAAYRKHLLDIEERFDGKAILLFVIDVPRVKIQRFVDKVKPTGLPVFFVDTNEFNSVEIGHQLTAPIYIWGEDGLPYPLVHHAQSQDS